MISAKRNRLSRSLSLFFIWQAVLQLSGCSPSWQEAAVRTPEPVPVNVVPVQRKKFSRPIISPGTVACIDKRSIACRTEGVLEELKVMPGQTVSGGEAVAIIDSVFLELEYERLVNQAEMMRNTLQLSRQERRRQLQNAEIRLIEIDRLELRLRKSERQLEEAQKNYNTESALHSTGSISAARLTDYHNRLLDAREAVQDLRHQVAALNIGLRDIDFRRAGHTPPSTEPERRKDYIQLQDDAAGHRVTEAELDLRAVELELERVRKLIDLSTIRSPSSGVISSVHTMEGEYLSRGSSICTLMNPASLFVRLELPESQSAVIRPGVPVRITGPNVSSALNGSIAHIYPEVDPRSRSISILCSLDYTREEMRPGMFVSVSIVDPSEKSLLALPKGCLKADTEPEDLCCFTVREGKAFEQPLQAAARSEEEVFFSTGLDEGDLVVLHPPSVLRDGFPVLLLKTIKKRGKE